METNENNADGFVTLELDELCSEERHSVARASGARRRRPAWGRPWKRKL